MPLNLLLYVNVINWSKVIQHARMLYKDTQPSYSAILEYQYSGTYLWLWSSCSYGHISCEHYVLVINREHVLVIKHSNPLSPWCLIVTDHSWLGCCLPPL